MATRKSGSGKSFRTGMSLVEAVPEFSDETRAEAWFVERRWPDGICCPCCEGDKVSPRYKAAGLTARLRPKPAEAAHSRRDSGMILDRR